MARVSAGWISVCQQPTQQFGGAFQCDERHVRRSVHPRRQRRIEWSFRDGLGDGRPSLCRRTVRHHVLKYDGTNGTFLGVFAADGPLAQPFGIKAGPDGHFYVVSGTGDRVARFHGRTGSYLGDFVPAGVGSLNLPIDLSFGPNGDLYVASFVNNKVARFNGATGAYISDFVAGGSGGIAGPNFMIFRPAQRFSANIPGVGPVGPIEQRHLGLLFTEGPAADANGNVYFTDVQASRIYKSDTRGL